MKVITIPKLSQYQHYKDRPGLPWIKWYRKSLRDDKFCSLTNAEKYIFIGLILEATGCNNEMPLDLPYLAQAIRFFPSTEKKRITIKNFRDECENGARMARNSPKLFREFSHGILKLLDLKLIAIKRIARCKHSAPIEKSRVDKNRVENANNNKNDVLPHLKEVKKVLKEHMKFDK